MNIGIVIKEVRNQKGLTQLDLSEQANLSERTIQRIENNEVEPSFYSLNSIGEILGITFIFNRQNSQHSAKKQEDSSNMPGNTCFGLYHY